MSFDSQLGYPGEGPSLVGGYAAHHGDLIQDGRSHVGHTFDHAFTYDRPFATRALAWLRPSPSRRDFQDYVQERRQAEQAAPPVVGAAVANNNNVAVLALPPAAGQVAAQQRPLVEPAAPPPIPLEWQAVAGLLHDFGYVRMLAGLRSATRIFSGRQLVCMCLVAVSRRRCWAWAPRL